MRGLNELLRNESTHLTINRTSYIFWTRRPTVFSLRDFLIKPQPEQVKAFIESPYRGRPAAEQTVEGESARTAWFRSVEV